jgi:predicted DsbA family dithiol-disulfide isomerase
MESDKEKKQATLATQMEQSLVRFAKQSGDNLWLVVISKVTSAKPNKRSVERVEATTTAFVKISDLEHVSVQKITKDGEEQDCVRLIFNGQMFATSGNRATTLIKWATETAESPLSNRVKNFPGIGFEQVVGQVKIIKNELVLA